MARKVGDRERAAWWARLLRLTVRVVVPIAFIGLLWYLHANVIRVGYVPSASMEPTLVPDDRILIRLDAYGTGGPQRGDIIVYADRAGELLVKRVIGIGGDRLEMASGYVQLNGKLLREPYLKQEPHVREFYFEIAIPDDTVFVLGDNRNLSADSRDRDVGPIPLDAILGRVTHIILPRARARRLGSHEYGGQLPNRPFTARGAASGRSGQ